MGVRVVAFVVMFALSVVGMADIALAQAEIGKVTRLQGEATETLGGSSTRLSAGSLVHSGSEIETGSDARLEIVFLDASQLTLGEEARITMDELVFSASAVDSGRVSQALQVFAGTFRLLSGAVGRSNPGAVSVSTPVATIGIRGTDFFGGPLAAGMPPGELHYGFMIIDGAIEVVTPQGSVILDEENEGTFLPMAGGVAPTEPTIWDQEAIDEAYASIRFE